MCELHKKTITSKGENTKGTCILAIGGLFIDRFFPTYGHPQSETSFHLAFFSPLLCSASRFFGHLASL